MLLLNIYALTTPPPFSYNLTATCPSENMVPIVEEAQNLWQGDNGCYEVPKFRIAIIWIVIATAAFRMIFEISQLVYDRLEYLLDITNLLEWCLYVFSILFVIDISSFDVEVSPASMRKVSSLVIF